MRVWFPSLALAAAAAVCLAASAAEPGQEFAIGVGDTDQRVPLVSYDSTRDDYLVVWLDVFGETLKSRAVSAKRSGEISLGKIRSLDSNAFPEALAYSPRRREHLLLSSDRPFERYKPLRATRLRPNGRTRGESLQIDITPGCGSIEDADLEYLPLPRRWLLVWGEENCGLKARRLKGRTLEFDGPEVILERSRFLSFPEPSLAYGSTAGEVLLTYRDTDMRVLAVRLDGDGRALSAGTVVPYGSAPVATYQPTRNRWLVTWESEARVMGRFVSSDGTLGEVFKLASRFSFSPAAAYNSFANRILVNWSIGNFGIKGRWYHPSAVPTSRRFRIGELGTRQSFWSTGNLIACSERANHCLAVWEKQVQRPGVISDHIYGEIVTAK